MGFFFALHFPERKGHIVFGYFLSPVFNCVSVYCASVCKSRLCLFENSFKLRNIEILGVFIGKGAAVVAGGVVFKGGFKIRVGLGNLFKAFERSEHRIVFVG